MTEDRNLKQDLLALGLLAAVVFMGVALATYQSSDPPSTLVYPPEAEVSNACGRSGAILAQWSLDGLGIGRPLEIFARRGIIAEMNRLAVSVFHLELHPDPGREARYRPKAQPAAHWAVASSYRIPLADAAMDALLRLFAPADVAECRRVLRPGGCLLTAVPGPQHLLGLKQALYAEPQLHDAQEPLPEGFVLEAQQRLTGSLRLDTPQAIADLLRMTPFYWNVDQATQARVLALPQLETPIEFALSLYRRLA